jgi:hypothetical protein
VSGGTAGGEVTVTGTRLDARTCQPKPPPPPASRGGSTGPGSCLVGRWVSTGVTGTDNPTGGAGVVLTITDAGDGAFAYTTNYDAMQPVTNPAGRVTYRSSGTEKGTLTPAGSVLNREVDDSGVTVTVTAAGQTKVIPGTGTHAAPAVTYRCSGATFQITEARDGGQVVDTYRRA